MIKDYDKLIPNLNEKCKLIIGNGFLLKTYKKDGHKLLIFNNIGSFKAVNRLVNFQNWRID